MTNLRINGIKLALDEEEGLLAERVADLLCTPVAAIKALKIVRKSLDARRERPPIFVYAVECALPGDTTARPALPSGITIERLETPPLPEIITKKRPEKRPVVIGTGPAGLFAAMTLATNGIPVLLLERGKPVQQRTADVYRFWEQGVLNPESHVYFGEGGAGTFSDGKLTSRRQNPDVSMIKETFVKMGAPAAILVEAKPHIGTDRLITMVANIRRHLQAMGCEVRFESRVTDFLVRQGRIKGIQVNGREEIETSHVVLAVGQAAEDVCRTLLDRGAAMVPKPFAMGVRIEHPQASIDRMQYGKWSGHPALPPAEYFVTAKAGGVDRSVYSFCMCPGGCVIGSSSEEGTIVTNGMSLSLRNGRYANSAVVVNVRTEDFADNAPLAGFDFRRCWEKKAYHLGGAGYCAPAQRLTDFLRDEQGQVEATSYLPAVTPAQLSEAMPSFLTEALKQGFRQFEQKMPGFITDEAVLIGVETRTSSPVRILRKPSGESIGVEGLYPCGEGAGYAGGIISSALDGIRAAWSVLGHL